MRSFVAILVVSAVAASTSLGLQAADRQAIAVTGTAYTVELQPLPNTTVQIRDLKTGNRIKSTVSDAKGIYTFEGLQPGTYVVEIVNASGRVVGMSAPFALGDSPSVTVPVVSVGPGAAAAGGKSGFGVLGMGPVTSLAVVGAASAAAVTAVVSTRPDASPSR